YKNVSDKHRPALPSFGTISQYLHLHWMLVALKQKQLGTAGSMAFPAVLSPGAWGLLQQAVKFRTQQAVPPVEKRVLVG
ncbi:MAG: glycosyltransferase family 2 protein, partial [Cyanobacteria bacterium J06629_9]